MSSSTKQVDTVEVFTPDTPARGALGITSKSSRKSVAPVRQKAAPKAPPKKVAEVVEVEPEKYLPDTGQIETLKVVESEPEKYLPDTGQIETLKVVDLILDEDVQPRLKMGESFINQYSAEMKEGAVFPPIVVYHDLEVGYYVADGFHRVYAAKQAGLKTIQAEVFRGNKVAAIRYSVGANIHGLPRTKGDAANAVKKFLKFCFTDESNRQIADICRVGSTTVDTVLGSLKTVASNPKAATRREADAVEISPEEAEKILNQPRVVKRTRNGVVHEYVPVTVEKPKKPAELKGVVTPRHESPNMIYRLLSAKLVTAITVAVYYLLKEIDAPVDIGLVAQITKSKSDIVERHLNLLVHWGLAKQKGSGWSINSKVPQQLIDASYFDAKKVSSGGIPLSLTNIYTTSLEILNPSGTGLIKNTSTSKIREEGETGQQILRPAQIRKHEVYLAAREALAEHFTDTELAPASFGSSKPDYWLSILSELVQDPEELNLFGWWYKRYGAYKKAGFSWAFMLGCLSSFEQRRESYASKRIIELAQKDPEAYWNLPKNKALVEKEMDEFAAVLEQFMQPENLARIEKENEVVRAKVRGTK